MIQAFPSRIVLELTPLCNLSCFMCPRHYVSDKDGFMDESLFKKLIDEIIKENPKAIVLPFWRGESCLHKLFAPLIQYAIDRGLRIHLSTNGHFMSEENCRIFYQCEFITFSIHTDIGYKNALKLIQNKPKDSQTTFQISFVDTEKTTNKYLQDCVSDSHLLGFDSVRLYKQHTIGGEFGKLKEEKSKKRHFCPKLVHTFVVSSDGYFSRCNHIWEPCKMMNLKDCSIKEVWESEVMQKIRREYPDKYCEPCDQWSGHTCGEVWNRKQDEVLHKVF
ncbi:MAG: SPASM domain-containing protein [Helicobacter sp.]|nr:SPASM domain-containing protein [Helicobacter sp.]